MSAMALWRQDPARFTQEVLAGMFGVPRETMRDWTNESDGESANAFAQPPDARVTASTPPGVTQGERSPVPSDESTDDTPGPS
jgi:hypothetical protein